MLRCTMVEPRHALNSETRQPPHAIKFALPPTTPSCVGVLADLRTVTTVGGGAPIRRSAMSPRSSVKTTTASHRDITRRVHPSSGKTFYEVGFRTYVAQRINELAQLEEFPEIGWPDPDDPNVVGVRQAHLEREAERNRRWLRAELEVSRAMNIRYAAVRNDFRDHGNSIAPEERQAFEVWEAASRRLEPLRSLVAVVRDLPEPSRDAMNAVWDRLGEADQASLRGVCGDYLFAAELVDEARRLLARAAAAAMAELARRHADEPLVAVSHVAEYEMPRAVRPLVDADLIDLERHDAEAA